MKDKSSNNQSRFKKVDRLVFLGLIGSYQGQREVIKAFSLFLHKYHSIKLVIVGGGDKIAQLKHIVYKMNITKQVVFTGRLPQKKIIDQLLCSQIGLLPLWNSPLHKSRQPLKLIEYLASGICVVAGKVGEAENTIEDGVNGYLTKAGDLGKMVNKVEELVITPKPLTAISKRALITAEEFVPNAIMPKWKKFLFN